MNRERRVEGEGEDFIGLHICSCTDGKDYVIRVGERVYFFQWSNMFGPLFVGARGQDIDNSRITHSALRAVSLWKRQGMRTEPQGLHLRAVWNEPPAGIYYRIGKLIVDADEPEGFDDVFSEVRYVAVTPAQNEGVGS